MHCAVLLPNWIGDAVMATPTLRALRRYLGPGARLTGIMRPVIAHLLAGTRWLDETLLYDRHARRGELGSWALIRALRNRRLDALILLPNSLSSGFVGWLSGAQRRIGYGHGGRALLLTDALRPPGIHDSPGPLIDRYLELAYTFGCPPEGNRVELATSVDDETAADRVWRHFDWDPSEPVMLLNTGSANSPARHWPTTSYVALARRIVETWSANVLVLGGPAERDTALGIELGAAHPRVRSLAEVDTSLGTSKACIQRSALLVTTDSGPRHIALAFQRPVILLSGPIDPRANAHPNSGEVWLELNLPCRPCGQAICPLQHHKCLRDLTVDRVFASVCEIHVGRPRAAA